MFICVTVLILYFKKTCMNCTKSLSHLRLSSLHWCSSDRGCTMYSHILWYSMTRLQWICCWTRGYIIPWHCTHTHPPAQREKKQYRVKKQYSLGYNVSALLRTAQNMSMISKVTPYWLHFMSYLEKNYTSLFSRRLSRCRISPFFEFRDNTLSVSRRSCLGWQISWRTESWRLLQKSP